MSEKLVRDNIVQYVFNKEGRTLNTRVAWPDEMLQLYKNKVIEEANEVLATSNQKELIEELGDLCSVITCFISHLNITEEVLQEASRKKKERGAFYDGVILITEDN